VLLGYLGAMKPLCTLTVSSELPEALVPLRDLLQMDGVDLTVREALPDPCLLSPVWTVRSLQLLLCAGYLT